MKRGLTGMGGMDMPSPPRHLALCLTAATLLAGCATSNHGFDRGALARAARVAQPEVTDQEIARIAALRPQLPSPFKLGVWFQPPAGSGAMRPLHRWRDEDREVVLAALRELQQSGMVSEVTPISDMTVSGNDLRAIRLAAARYGMDAVLVVGGAADTHHQGNVAGVLYITIVGLWVVPGTHVDAMFLATASMWDVRNEFLYLTVDAEKTAGETAPAMLIDDQAVVAIAKRGALQALSGEVAGRIRNLSPVPMDPLAMP